MFLSKSVTRDFGFHSQSYLFLSKSVTFDFGIPWSKLLVLKYVCDV